MEFRLKPAKTADTARFEFSPNFLDPHVVLIVRHAGRGNAEFKSLATKQATMRGTVLPHEAEQRGRDEDVELFARTVIVGWEGPTEPYTREGGEKLLQLLSAPRRHDERDADYSFRLAEFDRLRLFCMTTGTFRDPIGSAEDLGKG